MASRKLEEQLDRLRQLRSAPLSDDGIALLRKSLQDRSNLVVAEAARTASTLRATALVPDLLTALDRLYGNCNKTDPKCWGKAAIVKTLVKLDYDQSAPFVRGAGHVQMEPVWGGQEDTALHLRGNCLLALAQCSDLPRLELLRRLVDGLMDPGDPVRIETVRALAQCGGHEAVLLLRLKARAGDNRPLILGHVFDALLLLERNAAVDFVSSFVMREDSIRDEAILALGAAQLPLAVDRLLSWAGSAAASNSAAAAAIYRALSLSREERALEFLLDLIRNGPTRQAEQCVEALKVHVESPEIQKRVAGAVAARQP